jgi:hypothetical protein
MKVFRYPFLLYLVVGSQKCVQGHPIAVSKIVSEGLVATPPFICFISSEDKFAIAFLFNDKIDFLIVFGFMINLFDLINIPTLFLKVFSYSLVFLNMSPLMA